MAKNRLGSLRGASSYSRGSQLAIAQAAAASRSAKPARAKRGGTSSSEGRRSMMGKARRLSPV